MQVLLYLAFRGGEAKTGGRLSHVTGLLYLAFRGGEAKTPSNAAWT
jgi:hypothetical protein